MILSDISLARRLERAEGTASARFVEAHRRLYPGSGAEWIEVAGAYAMFDGPRSPITQTFGLGVFQLPSAKDLDAIEKFFHDRHAPVFHEVSPIADKALLGILGDRGYRPVELTSVMFLALQERAPAMSLADSPICVRTAVKESDRQIWARTATEGWRDLTGFDDLMQDLMRVSAAVPENVCFMAELDGHPVAAGALALHGGVALLAGASTVPEWRRRGAQRALLESRLQFAAQNGCELAMIGAEPGSASQRNAERQGFRIAYTRIKWGLLGR